MGYCTPSIRVMRLSNFIKSTYQCLYKAVILLPLFRLAVAGSPGGIRTHNIRIRNPVFYPLNYGGKMLCASSDLVYSI